MLVTVYRGGGTDSDDTGQGYETTRARKATSKRRSDIKCGGYVKHRYEIFVTHCSFYDDVTVVFECCMRSS